VNRRNALLATLSLSAAFTVAVAAAAAPGPSQGQRTKGEGPTEAETNEQIVSDFLNRRQRAEKAQRAILLDFRKGLDRKRAEYELAHKQFDDARGRYSEIMGVLPKQGITTPDDPRLPYEYEIQRVGPEKPIGSGGTGYLSRKPGESTPK
jgi:hypothetical protein